MNNTLPIIVCRHYNVEWLDSHTCKCGDCGKEGHWSEQGFAIWVRKEPVRDRQMLTPRETRRAKVA